MAAPDDDRNARLTPAQYAQLPDSYTRAQLVYEVLQLALHHFMSRLTDPLPYLVFTNDDIKFTEAGAARALAMHDGPSLKVLMIEHSADYYHLLLLGRLVLGSPLGPRLLPAPNANADALQLPEALPGICATTDLLLELCVGFLVHGRPDEETAAMREALAIYQQQLTDHFARLQHTLGSKLPLAPPLVPPPLWGHYDLRAVELHGLRAALDWFHGFPIVSDEPLAQAVPELAGYHPQRLEKLQAKLRAIAAPAKGRVRVRFTEWQMLALYQANRVVAYTFVSGEGFEDGGLDDYMKRISASSELGPLTDAQHSHVRQLQCALAEGFAKLIAHTMGDHPGFVAARTQVDALLER